MKTDDYNLIKTTGSLRGVRFIDLSFCIVVTALRYLVEMVEVCQASLITYDALGDRVALRYVVM